MQPFIDSIELSLATKNWYAAIAVALTLPDICVRLGDPQHRGRRHYIAWYDRYMLPRYKTAYRDGTDEVFMSGKDCYALRCAYLHAGMDDISSEEIREALVKFHFLTTGSHKIKFDDHTLVLNVQRFCMDVAEACGEWLEENAHNGLVIERLAQTVKIQTTGFSPVPGVWIGS